MYDISQLTKLLKLKFHFNNYFIRIIINSANYKNALENTAEIIQILLTKLYILMVIQ